MNQTTYKGPDHPHLHHEMLKKTILEGSSSLKSMQTCFTRGKNKQEQIPSQTKVGQQKQQQPETETDRFSKTETKLRKSGKSLPEEEKYLNDDLSQNLCSRKQKQCFTRTNNNSNADGSTQFSQNTKPQNDIASHEWSVTLQAADRSICLQHEDRHDDHPTFVPNWSSRLHPEPQKE